MRAKRVQSAHQATAVQTRLLLGKRQATWHFWQPFGVRFWSQNSTPPAKAKCNSSKTSYFTLIVKASETFPRKAFKRTRAGWISAYFIASAGRRALT
jgi:hypothetical protein